MQAEGESCQRTTERRGGSGSHEASQTLGKPLAFTAGDDRPLEVCRGTASDLNVKKLALGTVCRTHRLCRGQDGSREKGGCRSSSGGRRRGLDQDG